MSIEEIQIRNINHYGPREEAKKLVEEAAELLEAVVDFENGKGNIEHVIEEVGDVMFVINQFIPYYDIQDYELEEVYKEKGDRQLERMKEGK